MFADESTMTRVSRKRQRPRPGRIAEPRCPLQHPRASRCSWLASHSRCRRRRRGHIASASGALRTGRSPRLPSARAASHRRIPSFSSCQSIDRGTGRDEQVSHRPGRIGVRISAGSPMDVRRARSVLGLPQTRRACVPRIRERDVWRSRRARPSLPARARTPRHSIRAGVLSSRRRACRCRDRAKRCAIGAIRHVRCGYRGQRSKVTRPDRANGRLQAWRVGCHASTG